MEASVEVENVVRALFDAVSKGDIGEIENLFSQKDGVIAIGSDPAEMWAGYNAIVRAFTEQLQSSGARQIQTGEISAWVEGTVGWASELRTIRRSKGQAMSIRHTFVLHTENGRWKIVQMHVSIGVPNDELRQQDQPI